MCSLPEDLALHYLHQTLGALEHLHHKNVLHLDVKGTMACCPSLRGGLTCKHPFTPKVKLPPPNPNTYEWCVGGGPMQTPPHRPTRLAWTSSLLPSSGWSPALTSTQTFRLFYKPPPRRKL